MGKMNKILVLYGTLSQTIKSTARVPNLPPFLTFCYSMVMYHTL